jgi:hypothetical protein
LRGGECAIWQVVVRYIPLKNAIVAFFNPHQVQSKAPHGSQNADLHRHFAIASMR